MIRSDLPKATDGMYALVDESVLKKMFNGDKDATEMMNKMKEIKDKGGKMIVKTPMSHFLRAIYLADSKCTIHRVQKVLSFIDVLPSTADHRDGKACMDELVEIAAVISKKVDEKNKGNDLLKHIKYRMAQQIADTMYKETYGDAKANLWICHKLGDGNNALFKKGKCFECKEAICYDPSLKHHMEKNAKKVCIDCVLSIKKYSKYLTEQQRKILEKVKS